MLVTGRAFSESIDVMKVLIVGTIHCGHHGKALKKEMEDYNAI
jgi:hypothetical protein